MADVVNERVLQLYIFSLSNQVTNSPRCITPLTVPKKSKYFDDFQNVLLLLLFPFSWPVSQSKLSSRTFDSLIIGQNKPNNRLPLQVLSFLFKSLNQKPRKLGCGN